MYIAAVQMLLARNAEKIGGGSGRKLSETQTGDKGEGGTCTEVAELQGQEATPPPPLLLNQRYYQGHQGDFQIC